jgi:hypothetical protein
VKEKAAFLTVHDLHVTIHESKNCRMNSSVGWGALSLYKNTMKAAIGLGEDD